MNWKRNEADDAISTLGLHDGDGEVRRRRFFRDVTRLPVRIEVWELPPGSSEGSHIHDGDNTLEEFYYFISGRGVMWMGDEELPVGPGDAVMAPPGVDHGFRSTGDDVLKLVIAWGVPESAR
jgi:mannose-6-phosphate isomerase-like protein (cupin superfamily)